jgi:hypothetical protein
MKLQADKRRSEREFVVGTMVYMKIQLYAQSSITPHANQKLSFIYFGLFEVLERLVHWLIVSSSLILLPYTQWCMFPN